MWPIYEMVGTLGDSPTIIAFSILFAYYFMVMKNSYSRLEPHNTRIFGRTTIQRCFISFKYLLRGPLMVSQAYQNHPAESFAIPTIDGNYHVYVSAPHHIKELNNASIYDMSFNAAMEDQVKPHYTIYGFKYDNTDPNSSVIVRTLKAQLRPRLPQFAIKLQRCLQRAISRQLAHAKTGRDGWITVNLPGFTKAICNSVNNVTVVGDVLGNKSDFLKASTRYVEDAAVVGELLNILPKIVQPLVGYVGMNFSGAQSKLAKYIRMEVDTRLESYSQGTHNKDDCLQYIIDSSRTSAQRSPLRLTQQTMGLLFAMAHQMPMFLSFVFHTLACHPEYMEALRNEAQSTTVDDYDQTNDKAPLLDSFLRETARLNPLAAISSLRKTTRHFTFSDQLHVPEGNWIGVPQNGIMCDASNYEDPGTFNPYRYMHESSKSGGHMNGQERFTYPTVIFPFWGAVKQACPGRFYVSVIVKLFISLIILKYDISPVTWEQSKMIGVGPLIVPAPWLKIRLRERKEISTT